MFDDDFPRTHTHYGMLRDHDRFFEIIKCLLILGLFRRQSCESIEVQPLCRSRKTRKKVIVSEPHERKLVRIHVCLFVCVCTRISLCCGCCFLGDNCHVDSADDDATNDVTGRLATWAFVEGENSHWTQSRR